MRSGSRRSHLRRFHDPPVEAQLREKPLQLIITDTASTSEINHPDPVTTFCGNGDGSRALQHGKREFRQPAPPETTGSEINQIDNGLILIIFSGRRQCLRPAVKNPGTDRFSMQQMQQERRSHIPEQGTQWESDFSSARQFYFQSSVDFHKTAQRMADFYIYCNAIYRVLQSRKCFFPEIHRKKTS